MRGDGNPLTIERCTTCECDDQLICANGTCSMPPSEQERLPIRMQDKVQLVGLGLVDHVVLDAGTSMLFKRYR